MLHELATIADIICLMNVSPLHFSLNQAMFIIDPATGTVTVAEKLDRTMATEVTFDVTVTDMSATPHQVMEKFHILKH